MLENKGIDPAEVIRLVITSDGTAVKETADEEVGLIVAGYSVAEALLTKVRPADVEQLSLML